MKNEGDKSEGFCRECKLESLGTYKYRDVLFRYNNITVYNILVLVCDKCDTIIAVPHQSVDKIKEALKKDKDNL